LILAAKSAPDREILSAIKESGIEAVEIFLSKSILDRLDENIILCNEFSFKYAIHAPNDCFMPYELLCFAESVGAEIVVHHDILWDDEWIELINLFRHKNIKLCVENIKTTFDWTKFKRRYDLGVCLDLEHLIFEVGGIFKEEFERIIQFADHIHMTGYIAGSDKWHSHIHHSKDQSRMFLDMVKQTGFSGLIVSEARVSYQTIEEFKSLRYFFNEIVNGRN
jgi:hypothetical protein